MTGAMNSRGPDGIHHWVRGSGGPWPVHAAHHARIAGRDPAVDQRGREPRPGHGRSRGQPGGTAAGTARARCRAAQSHRRRTGAAGVRGVGPRLFAAHRRRLRAGDLGCAAATRRFARAIAIGNKPFHYHWDGKTFVFASDLHPILALPWVREELNEGMLAEFLANEWYSRDETFWQGVLRLVAAHRMTVDAHGTRIDQYWEPDLERDVCPAPATTSMRSTTGGCSRTSCAGCRDSLGRSHARSAAAWIPRRSSRWRKDLRRERRLLAPGLDGYTLAFTDDSNANEMDYARAVGEHLDTAIHEIAPTKDRFPGIASARSDSGCFRRIRTV